ncbi:hypothetical protein T440DRAFT_310145 [Plenodomus tracheiphilus IPT5]|uniref:Uncharacterized protein n=1 Tax=Plenodomus tracheiphilus IPT5 TaxID=1408161 RepID=A0A6A7BDG2_9PLEO|nr:hypothetical protein T440DRAFT_310145 [Plenodomus tracheiphilus IPT5]
MSARQRVSPLDFDVEHDEELPGYEESTAPAYDSGTFDDPITTYHLRQYDRKIQILVAYGPSSSSTSYRVTTNGFRLFSKKPDMEVLYTSQEMRQRSLATIAFDNDGPLPWRPRAHFDHVALDGSRKTYEMESLNFADWTYAIGNRMYAWALDVAPVSLILTEVDSTVVIARFTYSAKGTSAVRGGEVGELWIYRDALTMEQDGVDKAVCGLMVALSHLKKMGRHYSNGAAELERRDSVTRDVSPLHRAE